MNVDRVTSYYLRKLHTEISILKCVDHPNIVKVRSKFSQPIFFIKKLIELTYENKKEKQRERERGEMRREKERKGFEGKGGDNERKDRR